jgi:hypothetical protein
MKSQLPVYTAMYTVLGTLSVDFLPLKSMCLKRQNATNGIHPYVFFNWYLGFHNKKKLNMCTNLIFLLIEKDNSNINI